MARTGTVHLIERGQQDSLFTSRGETPRPGRRRLRESDEDAGGGLDHRDHLQRAMKLLEDAGETEKAQKIHALLKPQVDDEESEEQPDEGTAPAGGALAPSDQGTSERAGAVRESLDGASRQAARLLREETRAPDGALVHLRESAERLQRARQKLDQARYDRRRDVPADAQAQARSLLSRSPY
jgi:hypothetical protein